MITRIKSASSNSKIDLEIRLDWQSAIPVTTNGNSQPSTSPVLLSPTYTRSELFDSTNASAIINPLEMGLWFFLSFKKEFFGTEDPALLSNRHIFIRIGELLNLLNSFGLEKLTALGIFFKLRITVFMIYNEFRPIASP